MKYLFILFLFVGSIQSKAQTIPDKYAGIFNQTYMVPYAEKFELLADFFKDNPNEPWYFWMQATIYNQMNNNEKALENYQKAIRLDPFFSGAHASLARFYYYNDSTKLDVALKHINKAIKLEPDDYHYRIDKGNIYFEMKKYEFALDEANYLLSLPNFDRNLAVKLKIQVLEVLGSTVELHQFVRDNDLSNDGEFLGTDFALMLASIYEDMDDQTRACKLYNGASEPYNIMGEELPSEIMKNIEKCK
jgi:tetratricopeptide (TPR) repeat protein